jgi:hypothetical protein
MSIDLTQRQIAREAKAIVALAIRNGPIEQIHAGQPCSTCEDLAGFSRISDDDIKLIVKNAVDHVYALLFAAAILSPILKKAICVIIAAVAALKFLNSQLFGLPSREPPPEFTLFSCRQGVRKTHVCRAASITVDMGIPSVSATFRQLNPLLSGALLLHPAERRAWDVLRRFPGPSLPGPRHIHAPE